MAESNRAAFNTDLTVRQQYLSMAFAKIPGQADWTLLDQAKVITPASSAEEKKYNRIGDPNSLVVGGQVETDVTLQTYMDTGLEELALLMGVEKPGGGWVGTEELDLDPTLLVDIKIVNYEGTDVGDSPVSAEFVNRFRPLNFSNPEDADGDGRIVDISGKAVAYYIIPEAGT